MAEGTTPRGAVSALLRTTTASTTASDGGVGDSLECLVSAVDELKRSMGMGEGVDLTAIEQFIARLRQENEEFRQYAEQAILVRLGRRLWGRRVWRQLRGPGGTALMVLAAGCCNAWSVAWMRSVPVGVDCLPSRCLHLHPCRLPASPFTAPCNRSCLPHAACPLQSAQALKEERDELANQLEQVKLEQTMGAALAETQVREAQHGVWVLGLPPSTPSSAVVHSARLCSCWWMQ